VKRVVAAPGTAIGTWSGGSTEITGVSGTDSFNHDHEVFSIV
jgi:hypothetical protein